jgi:predicted RNA-binding Zn ribbon-like protein
VTNNHSSYDVLPPKKFQFVAGDLGLDFCNTVGGKRDAIPREHLNSCRDFISWCEQAGLLNKSEAAALFQKADRRPADGSSALNRAIELREAVYRIFAALAESKRPHAADLARLNVELARGLGRLRVVANQDGFAWAWANETAALDQALGPIARAAADLLAGQKVVKHVCQCKGDNCGWLFVDSSKNHSRRWCNMRDCGNRAKVRRHRLKQSKVR